MFLIFCSKKVVETEEEPKIRLMTRHPALFPPFMALVPQKGQTARRGGKEPEKPSHVAILVLFSHHPRLFYYRKTYTLISN
jgi:hypothetical protein